MPKLATANRSTTDHPMSQADVDAHRESTHYRRPTVVSQESPTPPTDPAARRRFVQQRQW
ncbi:hypothetical protein GTY67_13550 [Streptomyces sp. SID8374]|uniref:hypothetical protein n=1 Tax=Streptomyces sp. SID8374 TaxID=2690354 RepID=UPI0013684F19|nr:hypothetical protein [Streptomyces sp. SID8374]MYX14422.1 hypothetical protein [Streptomyces sp. SID8374]